MREQSEEHSLLVALAERMSERRVLVTFNGKSFDWPLLETRYRMTRAIKIPAPRAHIDFLTLPELWRLRLGSVRLQDLEKHVLGWNRGIDVMSEFDSFYLLRLFCAAARPIRSSRSFITIKWICADWPGSPAACFPCSASRSNTERTRSNFSAFRVSASAGENPFAPETFISIRLPARCLRKPIAPRAGRSPRLAKREGDLALACQLWEGMLGNSREGFEAYEQLAIHYEHRAKEPHRAASFARKALADLHRACELGAIAPTAYRQRRVRFERRLVRLERKASRGLLDALEAESIAASGESNQ